MQNITKCSNCRATFVGRVRSVCPQCGRDLTVPDGARVAPLPTLSRLGDELWKTLRWVKVIRKRKCDCALRRQALNAIPLDQVDKHEDRAVEMLRRGAAELELPFVEWLARRLVKRAIKRVKESTGSLSA